MAELRDKSWMDVHREGPQGDAPGSEGRGGAAASRAGGAPRGGGTREAPPEYFLPRHSARHTAVKYGLLLAAGIGAGMAVEQWIRKKVAEDGGYILKGGKRAS